MGEELLGCECGVVCALQGVGYDVSLEFLVGVADMIALSSILFLYLSRWDACTGQEILSSDTDINQDFDPNLPQTMDW